MKELNPDKWSMLQIANEVDKWRQKYHTDSKHSIIFQNRATLSNVVFTSNFLHDISTGNPRGFSNIPLTITSPDEIWSYWDDPRPKFQTIAIRNYIIFTEKLCYVVTTKAGVIIKASAVVPSLVQKYRKGVIIFKQ